MRYQQLGRSGLTVSVVGLGCIHFGRRCDRETSLSVVEAALEVGITLFDTASSYGEGESERFLGEALKGKRGQAIIATKIGSRRHRRPDRALGSRRHIYEAVEGCLQRLQTDYIDLFQLHFPDPETPIEETLATLDELVRAGKVRYIGSSNFAAWQIVEAEWVARNQSGARFISAQREYSLLNRDIEVDVVPACVRYGVGLLPWRPLGNGVLAGKYRRGEPLPSGASQLALGLTDAVFDQLEALERFAGERGLGLLDVAIGGFSSFPAVASVLVGARHPEQVRANAAAAQWMPSEADRKALAAVLNPEISENAGA